MKYCDAFCGLGGFSLAIHSIFGNEAECVWAIDYDLSASETFEKNFNIKCHGDIRDIDHSSVPDHDLLCGGFPCQPFSRNGKWFNHNDKTVGKLEERDNLFLELVKILNLKKPKYFLFENVKGLKSMKNMDGTLYFETIVSNLEALDYKVYTQILDAADYGLPQQRERIFFVGIKNSENRPQEFRFPEKMSRNTAIADILDSNIPKKFYLEKLWKNRKILKSVDPNKVKKVLSNHEFPIDHSRYEVIKWLYENNTRKPITKTGKIESVAILYGDTPSGLPRQQDKIYSIYGIAPTIATFSTPCIDPPEGLRQLTPKECARLQGIPDTHILPSKDAKAYKQIGNAVAVPMVSAILREIFKDELCLKQS